MAVYLTSRYYLYTAVVLSRILAKFSSLKFSLPKRSTQLHPSWGHEEEGVHALTNEESLMQMA